MTRIINGDQPIPDNMLGLDIGPKSIEEFSEEISSARTIVWNGPMGVFEMSPFSKGTTKIAHAVADNAGAISICGRRRLGGCREGRGSRGQDRPYFDGRRRIAGIFGRQCRRGSVDR